MEFIGHALPKTFRATHWHQGRPWITTIEHLFNEGSCCICNKKTLCFRGPSRVKAFYPTSDSWDSCLFSEYVCHCASTVNSFGFLLSLSLDLFPDPSCQFEDVWPQPSGSGSGSGMLRGRRFPIPSIPNSCPARYLQCTREDWCCPCLPNPRPRNMWSHRPICCGKPIRDLH